MDIHITEKVDVQRRIRLPNVFLWHPNNMNNDAMVITRDPQRVGVLVWSAHRWKKLLHDIETHKVQQKNDKVVLAFERCVIISAQHIRADSQGRITIPENLLVCSGLREGDDVRIFGNQSSLSLTNMKQNETFNA